MRVPRQPRLLLARKTGSDPSSVEAVAAAVDLRGVTLVGPGTTTQAVLRRHGLEGTLLGVDAVRDGELIGRDLDEAGVLALLDQHDDVRLLVGVVGGQGALFGRGNQQLSPAVLRRVSIEVLATPEKLATLDPPWLRVDTGDEALDAELCGYIRVHTGPGRITVMKVST